MPSAREWLTDDVYYGILNFFPPGHRNSTFRLNFTIFFKNFFGIKMGFDSKSMTFKTLCTFGTAFPPQASLPYIFWRDNSMSFGIILTLTLLHFLLFDMCWYPTTQFCSKLWLVQLCVARGLLIWHDDLAYKIYKKYGLP